jgi:hypothetical protein|tara:strand:+ start:439 stop:699 length:261 start_codon:yes stop_codon:yes gene_type:complete
MANKIILKNKGTASSAPTVHASAPNSNDDLSVGEVSINYVDGKLYYAKESSQGSGSYAVAHFNDSTQTQTSAEVAATSTALAIALG